MSFNGSGTFVVNSAGQPVVANTVISATVFNALTADLATGLSTCITKDGQTTVTANIPFGNNKITALGAGTAASDAANLGQVQSTAAKLVTVTGTDTITGTMSPALTAYAAGQLFYFIANAANTGAVTINIDGLGAKSITRDGSTALAGGDINSGEFVVIIYDGTRFQMINAANSFGNTTINGTLTVTGNTALQANVSITSTLSVGGTFAVTGAATLGSTLAVTGKSDLPTVSTASINAAVALITTGTVTNLTASGASIASANIGNLQFTAASIASINAGVAVVTNLTATSASIASMNAGVALLTTATVTSLTATGASVASANVGTAVVTGLTVTGASIASVNAGTATLSGNLTLNGGTANGVLYLNGSKVATSGSALTFDGANLGLGVTPSAWTSNIKALEGASGGALSFYAAGGFPGTFITSNAYSDGTNWIAKVTDQACLYTLEGTTGKHIWSVAASNTTAGNAITFTQAMTLDSSGNLMVGTTSAVGRFTLQDTGTTTEITLRSSGGVGNNNRARIIGGYESGGSDYGGYLAFNTTSSSNVNGERMRLSASGGLGIGYTAPGYKLDISEAGNTQAINIRDSSNSNFSVFGITPGTYNGGTNKIETINTTNLNIVTNGSTYIAFGTNATERMRLDASGNLGLGVTPSGWDGTAPGLVFGTSAKGSLSYAGGATSLGDNFYRNSIGYRYVTTAAVSLYQASAGTHAWYNAPSGTAGNAITFTQAMTLDANGQLLLGTTSTTPITGFSGSAKGLTVQSALATIALVDSDNTTDFISWLANSGGTLYLYNKHSTSPLVFGTNNAERARITADGYFKASNTGTYLGSTAAYHELRSNGVAADWTARISNTTATAANNFGVTIEYTGSAPNGTGNSFLSCADNAATRATIRSNGGLANYQANNVDLSDARTKNSITPAASMWDKVAALEIVTYKYNDQTHDDVNLGVIAQQVESVEPVWVDADGFGETPEGEEPLKTVYTKDITFAAIKALQEAMARIEQLEAKVAALEAR